MANVAVGVLSQQAYQQAAAMQSRECSARQHGGREARGRVAGVEWREAQGMVVVATQRSGAASSSKQPRGSVEGQGHSSTQHEDREEVAERAAEQRSQGAQQSRLQQRSGCQGCWRAWPRRFDLRSLLVVAVSDSDEYALS